jgi:hypothetical protein
LRGAGDLYRDKRIRGLEDEESGEEEQDAEILTLSIADHVGDMQFAERSEHIESRKRGSEQSLQG